MDYRPRMHSFTPIGKQERWGYQFAYTPINELDPPQHTIYPSFIDAEEDAPLRCFIYTFSYDLVGRDAIVRNLPRFNSEQLRETIRNLITGMTLDEAWKAAYRADHKNTVERLRPLLDEEQRLPPEYRRGLEEFADERL